VWQLFCKIKQTLIGVNPMNCRNRATTALFAVLSVWTVVGFPDTAQGQTTTLTFSVSGVALNPNTPTLSFTVPSQQTASQQLQVMPNNPSTLTVTLPRNTPSWLQVSPLVIASVPANTAATFTVGVNTNGLGSIFSQQATFTIGVEGSSAAPIPVTVNLAVGTSTSAFTVYPSSSSALIFTGVQGTLVGSPAQIPLQINYTGNSNTPPDYFLTITTTDGNNWLEVSPSCPSSSNIHPCVSGTGGTGTQLEVSVNPSARNLVPSSIPYQGTIVAQSTSSVTDAVSIPVTFTLGANSTLTVTPLTPPPFLYESGSPATVPTQQTLEVTATGAPVPFSASVTQMEGGPWLVPGLSNSTATSAPTAVSLLISSSGIPASPGKYNDILTIASTNGAAAPVTIPVSLVVTAGPLLHVNDSALTFSAPFASTTAVIQQVSVTSSGAAVGFSIAQDPTAPWLFAQAVGGAGTASSTTAATINITVNPSNLATGIYNGTIQISPTTGDQYSLPVTVTLNITTTSQLTSAPPLLHFSWETSQFSPASQNVQIGSVGQPVTFTATAPATTATATCPANWLEVGAPPSNAMPATLPISVVTAGMTAGFCTAAVTVTPTSGSGVTPLSIPVTVDVSANALLNVSFPAGFGVQTVAQGAGQSTFQIFLTSTDPVTPVQFTATSSASWLAIAYDTNGPSSTGETAQNLQVIVSPGQLTPGIYHAAITISSASLASGSLNVPYTLTVTPNVTVSVTPSSTITFTQPVGGPGPSSTNLTLTSSAGTVSYTAQVNPGTGGNWLQVNSGSTASGTLSPSGTLTLSVNPTVANALSTNTYTSAVTLAFPGTATATATVTVNLIVSPQSVSVSPTSLAFSYQTGGAAPASQALSVTSNGGTASFTATASSTGNWLSIDTSSGSTPKTINVSINPQNIPAGSAGGAPLTGTVSISAPSVQSAPLTVNVTLTVTAAPTPQPSTISSGASLTPGAIAPGEFITIKGVTLGPATPASFSLNAQGGVNSTLAGVQVLFGSVPGTPTYVSATQINVVVPFEIAGNAVTNISVVYQGIQSAPIPQQVVQAAPSIFTFNATGQGQAVAGNVTGPTAGTDNGPVGGVAITGGTISTSPIVQGQYFFVYATGGGLTNPASTTGSVNSTTTLMPLMNWTQTSGTVTATVGGMPATITFAGAAPGLINGVYQFDIQAPVGVSGNALPLAITIDGVSTPAGPTIAVQ
jgi:uncharacterized protein (TIGR03437 family)